VGIGPFRYAAWKRGDQIELERNPYYWRGRPALDRVIMKLIPDRNTVLTQLQTGELDMWSSLRRIVSISRASDPNVHIIRQPSYAVNEMLLNLKGPVLADRSVREALRYAVDRRLLRDKVGHGVGILQNVIVPTIDPSTRRDIPFTAFDPAKPTPYSMRRDGHAARTAYALRTATGYRSRLLRARERPTPTPRSNCFAHRGARSARNSTYSATSPRCCSANTLRAGFSQRGNLTPCSLEHICRRRST